MPRPEKTLPEQSENERQSRKFKSVPIQGRKVTQKKYESMRDCHFLPKWKNEFPWVNHEDDTDLMFCDICRQYPLLADKTSAFYVGTQSYRVGNLQSHQKSTNHEWCEYEYVQSQKKEKAKPKGKVYEGPMDLQRKKIDEMDKQKIKKLLNTAYFVMKNEFTFKQYEILVELQKKNSLNIGNNYLTDQGCRRFIPFIYETLIEETINKIKKANFISIMFDGSTDASNVEIDPLYIRILNGDMPQNIFLCMGLHCGA